MIGVFDSGSGGLTVAAAIRRLDPHADLMYFGDLANAPYGNRTNGELSSFTDHLIQFLEARGATTIVSACNSISCSVIRPRLLYQQIIEMVGPAVTSLVKQQIHEVAILATVATCRSNVYSDACKGASIHALEIPCPTLATGIELGDKKIITKSIREALQKIPPSISHVLLACTHYPLVCKQFEQLARKLGRRLTFIDPASAVAEAALRQHGEKGVGQITVFSSKRSSTFDCFVTNMLGVKPADIQIIS